MCTVSVLLPAQQANQTDPFTFDHREDGIIHVLLCALGSETTIKIPNTVKKSAYSSVLELQAMYRTIR